MSELTNIHARSVKDLTTPTELPVYLDALEQVKLVAGNFPTEYAGNEALTVKQIKDLATIDLESKVEVALSNLSTTANKFYPTLSEANNHLATMSVNDVVTIGEEANKGLWYKATAGATTLTKSAYDPLTQANNYTNNKAIATKTEAVAIANNYTDLVFDAVPTVIAPYVAQAEAAATAATISAGVFETPEAGVDPTTGVEDGEYFNVRSPSSDSYIDEYQNIGGSAVATGKSYLSALGVQQQEKPANTIKDARGKTQQEINDSIGAKWRSKPNGYALNDRVQLDNGDIVKSTVDGNTTDPNVNTTGWELVENSIFVPSVTKLLTMKPKENRLYNVHSYHDGGQLGGSSFIAVQSNMLTENGVTVFRSNVVGFEDYFWVRVNISHITPEMAGAIGDKVYNCHDAFQKCFNVGGDLRLNENSKYLVYGDDITTHRDTYILKCTKPTSITCVGKASVYFKHDVVTGSPRSIIFEGVSENLASLKMEGVDWYGHETEGHANKVNRAWGIGLFGVDNYSIKRCKFSTFQGHCPDITRRKFSNNGDWIQSSDLNQANTSEAINRLMNLSSKNGIIENIQIRHAGSTGLAFFGADQVSVDGVDADMTGSLYNHSVWADDASSQTALKDYALNRGINIKKVKGGSIELTGCTTATVTGCNVDKINVRAYDFDQQKNNFDSGTHTYNIDDHLSAPFLWMQNGGFVRRISIYSNCLNKLEIRSIFVDAYKNYFYSRSDGYEFITCDKNGILWGNGSSYSDDYSSFSAGVKSNVTENTFILNHNNCICVTYGTASANSYINVTDSIIEKTNPAFVYTHMRNADRFYRRDSYYETDTNDGHTLSKRINHHVDVKQGLLTQGVGANHLKTFVNIFGSASDGQTFANFTNKTTLVYFFVNLIDIAGRLFRKKVIVAADNTITVSDLDSQTAYNASFSVTVTSSVIELKITPAGNDLCLDVIGIGTKGNCVFLIPKERSINVG